MCEKFICKEKAEYELFKKIGVKTLEKVFDPQCDLKKELAVTFLDKLCHFINKFIRGVSGGYLGYDFSAKEAKEALLDVLSAGKALNENTRFNEVCNSYAAKVKKEQSQINLDGGLKYQQGQ